MRGRNFEASQLLLVEDLLNQLSLAADAVAMDVGVHADEIHYDGKAPADMRDMLLRVRALAYEAQRAEGLLRAYQLFWNATTKREEGNDDARVSDNGKG